MALAPDERPAARDERADAGGESTWAVTIRNAATGDEKAQFPETTLVFHKYLATGEADAKDTQYVTLRPFLVPSLALHFREGEPSSKSMPRAKDR